MKHRHRWAKQRADTLVAVAPDRSLCARTLAHAAGQQGAATRTDKGIDVEPMRGVMTRQSGARNLVDPLAASAGGDARPGSRGIDSVQERSQKQTALHDADRGNLPTTEQLIEQKARIVPEVSSPAERQIVDDGRSKVMTRC